MALTVTVSGTMMVTLYCMGFSISKNILRYLASEEKKKVKFYGKKAVVELERNPAVWLWLLSLGRVLDWRDGHFVL